MTVIREMEHDEVYGKTFALHDAAGMDAILEPSRQRFEANNIDAREAFEAKVCLDAGCGNGRGALFMLRSGAASVTAVDVSGANIESTNRNLRRAGFDNFDCREATLERLPFDDESFDFVWCNGVINHTAAPDRCLREITRVLKKDEQAWIYIYGTGGLFWYAIDRFREVFDSVSTEMIRNALQLMQRPVPELSEHVDNWKVAYLRTFSRADFGRRLNELGYRGTDPLCNGLTRDTSHRRVLYPQDAAWLGEGDLRYFLTRSGPIKGDEHRISDNRSGSSVRYDEAITSRFASQFDLLLDAIRSDPVVAVLACSNVEHKLHGILSAEGPLAIDDFEVTLREATTCARRIASVLGG